MSAVGDRVGAILSSNEKAVNFLGFGIYEGDFVPPVEVSTMLNSLSVKNPRIKLDSGKTVYGCECWWGAEAGIQKYLDAAKATGVTIETVDIDEARAAADVPLPTPVDSGAV